MNKSLRNVNNMDDLVKTLDELFAYEKISDEELYYFIEGISSILEKYDVCFDRISYSENILKKAVGKEGYLRIVAISKRYKQYKRKLNRQYLIEKAQKTVFLYNNQRPLIKIKDFCFERDIDIQDFEKYLLILKEENDPLYKEYCDVEYYLYNSGLYSNLQKLVRVYDEMLGKIGTHNVVGIVEKSCFLCHDVFSELISDKEKLLLYFTENQIHTIQRIFECYSAVVLERLNKMKNELQQRQIKYEEIFQIAEKVIQYLNKNYLSEACALVGISAADFRRKYLPIIRQEDKERYSRYVVAFREGEEYRRKEDIEQLEELLTYDLLSLNDEEFMAFFDSRYHGKEVPFAHALTRGIIERGDFSEEQKKVLYEINFRYFKNKEAKRKQLAKK